jgi:hypothetical protein
MAVVLLAVIGAAGYFGYDWWNKRQAKAEADAAAAKAATAAAQAATEKKAAAEKPLPVLPPTWSLDVASAKIPEGQANGSLGGTNFVVENAVLNKIGTAQVLALRPAGTSIDRDLMIYLHLAAGESLPGHNWTISQDMKGTTVPQILKRWKATPNSALQQKFFNTGYAMKLELGQAATDGAIPGKIFLSLPDPEQSVVAGIFKITTTAAADQAAAAAQNAAAVQAPGPAGAPAANRAAFDKRYGAKRP